MCKGLGGAVCTLQHCKGVVAWEMRSLLAGG